VVSGSAAAIGPTIIGKPQDMIYLSCMQRALVIGGARFTGSHVQPLPDERLEAANAELSARGMTGVGGVA
jgi:hypothetical protein